MKVYMFNVSSTSWITPESRSSSFSPDCVWTVVDFGETTEPIHITAFATVWDNAQYKAAIPKLQSFSSLLGVMGSKTGKLIADEAKWRSTKVAETLEK